MWDHFESLSRPFVHKGLSPIDDEFTEDSDIVCARQWMEAVLDHLYVTGDVDLLEDALEELCAFLDVEMTKGPLKIQKKEED